MLSKILCMDVSLKNLLSKIILPTFDDAILWSNWILLYEIIYVKLNFS